MRVHLLEVARIRIVPQRARRLGVNLLTKREIRPRILEMLVTLDAAWGPGSALAKEIGGRRDAHLVADVAGKGAAVRAPDFVTCPRLLDVRFVATRLGTATNESFGHGFLDVVNRLELEFAVGDFGAGLGEVVALPAVAAADDAAVGAVTVEKTLVWVLDDHGERAEAALGGETQLSVIPQA